jgi:hypothetical protein
VTALLIALGLIAVAAAVLVCANRARRPLEEGEERRIVTPVGQFVFSRDRAKFEPGRFSR